MSCLSFPYYIIQIFFRNHLVGKTLFNTSCRLFTFSYGSTYLGLQINGALNDVFFMQEKYFVYKPSNVELHNPKTFFTIAKVLILKRLAIQPQFPIRGTPRHIYAKRVTISYKQICYFYKIQSSNFTLKIIKFMIYGTKIFYSDIFQFKILFPSFIYVSQFDIIFSISLFAYQQDKSCTNTHRNLTLIVFLPSA